ncbi:hypothetical protein [Shewanella sp. SNU WT4]|uniref:hypothetical protein n=1 Tax=Shewanella sp. SNU WT4 TaxID=2590015 RepID=UPI00143D47DF|nr:hypothetical protein [Shewanella sp. SNU WT4]
MAAKTALTSQTSQLWQHIAELKPCLRKHVRILVQDYRSERWYLLHDESSGRFNRFNATAFEVIGRLNGDFTVQEIMHLANASLDATQALTPEDILQILAQLHSAEVLRDGLPYTAEDVFKRYSQSQRQRRRTLSNPLSLRIPLFDPNRLLNRLAPLARLSFSPTGLAIWFGIILFAVLVALTNISEISAAISAKTLSTSEVLSFWLLYPVVKIFHELGHGMAVKAWGGEVHETGITLLVFMPVPYVDASASCAFRDKKRRAMVAAAGIAVEMLMAAFGLFIWLLTEPGIIHETALNLAMIGSISTLLFNGNPLLRLDGYYVLEDMLEIPNLASRSGCFYLYLIQKYLLKLTDSRSPVTADGERGWFIFYGLASPLYRLFVLVGIAIYLSSEFLIIGVILACWAIFIQLIRPLIQTLTFLVTSQRLEAKRTRGFVVLAVGIMLVCGLLMIPVPLITQAQGVVAASDNSRVLSVANSFVKQTFVHSDKYVTPGEILFELEDETLITSQKTLFARLNELKTQQASERKESRVRGDMIATDIDAVSAELAQINSRIKGLLVRSPAAGRFVFNDPDELRGQFVHQGDVLGYIIQDKQPMVRAVISQKSVGLLRTKPLSIEVMLADRLGVAIPATIIREVPAGSTKLPHAALGVLSGGDITIDTHGRTITPSR